MKFVHFGCWSRGFCNIENPTNGLSFTMKRLNDFVKTNKIDFITIAGDNYYPDKKTIDHASGVSIKEKYFIPDDFYSGFNCLPKGIKKYVALGNHELQDNVYIPDDPEIKKCYSLLKQQQYAAESGDELNLFNDVISFTVDNESTLILIIDTTIYEMERENASDDINIKGTCYEYIFPDTNFVTINELIKYQEAKILRIISINSTVKNVIFIAHHPIVSITYSKKKKMDKKEYNKKLCNFICSIDRDIYYLCADTHFYEEGLVNKKINQYIVGTGGADQDTPSKLYENMLDDGTTYDIIKNLAEYGFIVVDITDGNVNINFISSGMNGGYIKKIDKYIKKIEFLNK